MPTPRIHLLAIVSAALTLPLVACNCPDDDTEYDESYEGELVDDELTAARDAADSDEDRCKAGCEAVSHEELDSVTSCEAVGAEGYADKPWDVDNTSVTIKCTAHFIEPAFCTGRRPLGHREAEVALGSRAAWFAAHAHLERASVAAFTELATWLQRRGAPDELRARCLAAAADEVVHADALEALALREGAEVLPPGADPVPDDLFTVALHNAVEGCISEAFAAMLATWQAEHAAAPALRALFTTISADELRHGQLAWDLHAWLWDQLTPAEQQAVAQAQQRAQQALPAIAASNAAMTPRELGWPTPEHAAALAGDFARRLHVDLALAA